MTSHPKIWGKATPAPQDWHLCLGSSYLGCHLYKFRGHWVPNCYCRALLFLFILIECWLVHCWAHLFQSLNCNQTLALDLSHRISLKVLWNVFDVIRLDY